MNNNSIDTWKIWYHSSKNSSWNNQSYKNIFEINNLYDLKFFIDSINLSHIKTGMFFIMKSGIFPTWEDKQNRDGCCISYKIYDDIVKSKIDFIILELLINDLKIKNNTINGLSIVPKKNYCIVKLWLKKNIRKNEYQNVNIDDISFNVKNAIFKKHVIR